MQFLAAKIHFVAPKRLPKSLKKASWRLQESQKGVRLAPTREQPGEPTLWGGVGEGKIPSPGTGEIGDWGL